MRAIGANSLCGQYRARACRGEPNSLLQGSNNDLTTAVVERLRRSANISHIETDDPAAINKERGSSCGVISRKDDSISTGWPVSFFWTWATGDAIDAEHSG